jgi:hypothetical protein
MFLYYFYRSRKVFNPRVHYKNLVKRYESGNYVDDVSVFVKPTVKFDLTEAAKHVVSHYSFLNELDSRDIDFLRLAGILLGKKVPKESLSRLQKVDKPLGLLFGAIGISKEASEVSTNEIKLFPNSVSQRWD